MKSYGANTLEWDLSFILSTVLTSRTLGSTETHTVGLRHLFLLSRLLFALTEVNLERFNVI